MHLKRDKVDFKKSHRENVFFAFFLQSAHQVDMKNFIECYKEFLGCFNALETYGEVQKLLTSKVDGEYRKSWYTEHAESAS